MNSNRVQHPFGAPSSYPPVSPFQQPLRLNADSHSQSRRGKGKGKAHNQGNSIQEEIGDSPKGRVSNPFAVGLKQPLSLAEAVSQFKSEYLKKGGYPFSCFGQPDQCPIIQGDISPAELRFFLSQDSEFVRQAISERSQLMNTDFSDFLRWSTPGGALVLTPRTGPYRVPDPEFPSFVPRNTFSLRSGINKPLQSEQDLDSFKSNHINPGSPIPLCAPPLGLR